MTTVERLSEDFSSLKTTIETRLENLEQSLEAVPLETKGHEGFDKFARQGETKSLTTQKDETGGYLIPQQTTARFYDFLNEYSTIRKLARVDTVSTDSLELLTQKEEADAGWVQEIEERPETKAPEFHKQKISVHELYAKPCATQKLIEDSMIDLEPWLIQKIAEKMAALENHAFIYGDGQNKPKGVLTYAGKELEVLKGKGADFFFDIQSKLPSKYLKNSTWLMSPSAYTYVRKLKDPTTGQFLWQPGLQENMPHTLLGLPVVICDQLPPVNEGASVIFGSFYDGYQIVDRFGLSVMRDPFSHKPFVEFYARKRVGGDVINFQSFKIVEIAHD